MRCAEFEKRLHRLLDRRESPSEDSRLNRHADRCPECRETLAACGRMIDGLNLLELPVPGDDFPLRVVRRTRVGRPSLVASRRFNAAWAAIVVTLALALLLPFASRKTARSRLPHPARWWRRPCSRRHRARSRMAPVTPARNASEKRPQPEASATHCIPILTRHRSATASRLVAQLDSFLVRPLEPRGRFGRRTDAHHDASERCRRRDPPDDPARSGRPPRGAVGRFGPGPLATGPAARRVKRSDQATRT